jgi:ribosomal protein L35
VDASTAKEKISRKKHLPQKRTHKKERRPKAPLLVNKNYFVAVEVAVLVSFLEATRVVAATRVKPTAGRARPPTVVVARVPDVPSAPPASAAANAG